MGKRINITTVSNRTAVPIERHVSGCIKCVSAEHDASPNHVSNQHYRYEACGLWALPCTHVQETAILASKMKVMDTQIKANEKV